MPPPPPPAAAPPPALRPVAVPQEQLLQTATIRNSVNLKKNSLALVPVDGNPRRLAVTFTFDSSVPCRRALPLPGTSGQAALQGINSSQSPNPQYGVCVLAPGKRLRLVGTKACMRCAG